jgi:hypothetical protein
MPTDSALDNDNPSEVRSHAPGARFAILDSLFSQWISSLSEIRQARTSQNEGHDRSRTRRGRGRRYNGQGAVDFGLQAQTEHVSAKSYDNRT